MHRIHPSVLRTDFQCHWSTVRMEVGKCKNITMALRVEFWRFLYSLRCACKLACTYQQNITSVDLVKGRKGTVSSHKLLKTMSPIPLPWACLLGMAVTEKQHQMQLTFSVTISFSNDLAEVRTCPTSWTNYMSVPNHTQWCIFTCLFMTVSCYPLW